MKARSHTRKMRRALGLLTALAALGVGAGSALAGPVVPQGASWTAITSNTGHFTTPDGGNSIYAPGNVAIPAGANLQTQYCNQFGPATQLVGATVRRVRWQATANDFTAMLRIQDTTGTDIHNRYLYNNAGGEMQQGITYDDFHNLTPGQCMYGGIYANGASTPVGFTPTHTNQLLSVNVEDLQGPAVSGPISDGGWVTGGAANFWWTTSDNSYLRGNTYASITGGALVDVGDQPNGQHYALVGVGALADGSQTICGVRNAASAAYWAPAQACTVFKLDRTDPGVPAIALTPDTGGAWTNTNVSVSTAATGDGTGSGWSRNQFSNDGGAWYDSAANFVRSTEGTLTLATRAVDVAGRVSGASTSKVIKIDKTAPIAQVSVASQATAGLVTLSKGATADGLSGLKSFVVRLGAADGPIVATNDAELVNIGATAPAKNAGAVKFYLTATDNAGNTATGISATVRLDDTAPSAAMQVAPAGWIKDFDITGAVDNRLSVTLGDNLADGLGPIEVQIRQGGVAGAWKNMATYNQPGSPNLSQGQHLLNPSMAGLGLVDGTAEIRVVAHDPTFNSLQSSTPVQTVKIDATSPAATDITGWASAPTGTPGFYKVTLPTLTDITSGLAKVQVEVNSDNAGGQADAGFAVAGSVTAPTGTATVTADITGLTAGIHATRIRATDNAGNVYITTGPVISLDTSLPAVSIPVISADGTISFNLSDAGGFGACPVKIEINGPATNAAWQVMFEQAAGTLPAAFSYQLPMSGMANGDYQVRTSVCDAAGNTTVQTKLFSWTGGPNFSSPGAPGAPGSGGTTVNNFVSTELKADGQLGTRVINGKVLPVIRRIYNRTFVLRGHLQKPDSTALAGQGLELRDSAGRYITGGKTDAAGNFTITARGTIGGVWTVNPVGQTGRDAAALLEVKPIANVRMKITKVQAARKLVVTGRLLPSAGSFNKAIQLQWRDSSGKWRPALNGRVAKNGTFRMTYQFRKPGGYNIQFRVSVPTDNGWPYLATTSRIVKLKVT